MFPSSSPTETVPPGVVVLESPIPGDIPLYAHPGWSEIFPWLVQGTTGTGQSSDEPFDLRLFGPAPAGEVMHRWELLRGRTGMTGVVHARQVHGRRVHLHGEVHDGLRLASPADGHATRARGLLLAVASADCVPISLVAPGARSVALLHAGWRGAAAGILEEGVDCLRHRLGIEPGELHVHLGPAICGACYEVGGEVHVALGLSDPGQPTPVDVRAVLARRAEACGIEGRHISRSGHCTRCGPGHFFSHRGGDAGRQVGVLGVVDPGASFP